MFVCIVVLSDPFPKRRGRKRLSCQVFVKSQSFKILNLFVCLLTSSSMGDLRLIHGRGSGDVGTCWAGDDEVKPRAPERVRVSEDKGISYLLVAGKVKCAL